ncbi:MAG TPA: DNA repair protein RecN [Candidatus Limnocylindrales bacterium]
MTAAERRAAGATDRVDLATAGAGERHGETAPGRPQGVAAGRLLEIAVRDLALIESLRLELAPGLNVLTGETGAGKSLLIDALGLALGARADTGLVRHGRDAARVEALFDRLPEPLIAVRDVAAGGRSTARLDDETVPAARLAETTGPLVELHGQHEQQRLLDERWQRELLDAYGDLAPLRAEMARAVAAWRANQQALDALAIEPRELARRLALHEHEAAEIAAARLRVGEADEIRAALEAARHGEAIAGGSAALHDALLAEGSGARDLAATAGREARDLARLDPRYAPLAERLAGLAAELEDVAAEARSLAESVEHDPAALARLEERLSVIYSLERKYGDDEAAVLTHGERAAGEVARLRGLDDERATRAAEAERLLAVVADVAGRLSEARRATAGRLAAAVGDALADLGFRQTGVEIAVGRRPAGRDEAAIELDGDAVAFDATGADEIVFRIAPNPGEPARPLARIASGGELSRLALAFKEVLAEADATPTLVFDEIDTGIGGRSAEPVGRSLWSLARRHQVLCVTHLPQIAAYADAHFRISKHERGGRTVTEVERLGRDERLAELAAMLGGEGAGPAALAGAQELLARAEAWRGAPAIPA